MEQGEAIYLPAGELHAYLDGLGIELMANSDNVLRGGLTPKYIDVTELLNVVNFESEPVQKVTALNRDLCQTSYETPAEEFQLSMISVDDGNAFISPENRTVEILFFLKGEAEVSVAGNSEHMIISRGNSVIVPSNIPQYRIKGNTTFYIASIPV